MFLQRSRANDPAPTTLPGWSWLGRWAWPAVIVLLTVFALQRSWHAHWSDLVWSVRDLSETQWPASFTSWRLWLDASLLGLGAVVSALLVRFGSRPWRFLVAGVLLMLALLHSTFPVFPGLSGTWAWVPMLLLAGVTVAGWLERPARTPRLLLTGYAAALLGALVWQFGSLPLGQADNLGRPWGSVSLPAYWMAVLGPTLRNLGWVALLMCAGLVWLERSPGALRGGLQRAAVYLTLSVGTALTFTVLVGLLGHLLPQGNQFWLLILTATLVAVGMEPARRALNRSTRQLLFGDTDDPARVLQRLSGLLATQTDAGLSGALAEVGRAMRLRGLQVKLLSGEVISFGPAVLPEGLGNVQDAETFPLVSQGERLGVLQALRRSPGEAFSTAERELLEAVARQLAGAVQAWQLRAELARAQDNLIRAGEEERLRLRRDLHDGLGPALSALGLKIEAARLLLSHSPEKAGEHLLSLKTDVQDSVGEVRRIVHDLRPPKLDDLGLSGALQELMVAAQDAGLHAICQVEDTLPPLDAATQVALYRIAQEALTNVLKHAQASAVTLQLNLQTSEAGRAVVLECRDNGVGLPGVREAGVGSRSMRERAGALSGTLELLSPAGGGTLLRAALPLRS